MTPNETGFLAMVRWSEVLSARADVDPYRCVFGFGHVIEDMSDHPTLTGEWPGLARANGQHTTAAGAYQIEVATWRGCKHVYGAKDFSPEEQDRIALALVNERRAVVAINAGDIETAIARCSAEWASLPGSQSGQPQKQMAQLMEAYAKGRNA